MGLHQLDQDAAESLRVHERDPRPSRPRSGRLVDQRHAGGTQAIQSFLDAAHAICHVVEAFAPSGQEPSHRRVRAEGPEELDEGRTGTEEDLFHSLILDHLTVHRFDPQRHPILGDGGGQITDGDPDVVDVEQNLVRPHAVTASAFDGPLPAPAGAG